MCFKSFPQWSPPVRNSRRSNTFYIYLAGAFGCTISGAGPTCVAVVSSPSEGERVAEAMVQAFIKDGKLEVNSARVSLLDQEGARTVPAL